MLGFFALFYHLQFSQNKNSTRENFGDTAKAHKPRVFINLTEVSATIICATKKPREEKVLLVFRSLSSSEAPRSSSLAPPSALLDLRSLSAKIPGLEPAASQVERCLFVTFVRTRLMILLYSCLSMCQALHHWQEGKANNRTQIWDVLWGKKTWFVN